MEQNAWGGTAVSTGGDIQQWVRQTSGRNGLNIVNSALKLRGKLNNLSRGASLTWVFLESNKWTWSSLGQQALEQKDRAQDLHLREVALWHSSTSSHAVNLKLL